MKELRYVQSTGRLYATDQDGKTASLGSGYSGAPPYVNDPGAETLIARGPIPRGSYKLHGPFNHVRLGPVVFFLAPKSGTVMHGRSGFFIHGDNSFGNRTASHGCIVLGPLVRNKIVDSGIRDLVVV